ncbi:uncharacterized protein [Physcomitrium patens]|uniref:Rab-GAP TBC domain-containing protein n=1 Tax=Physcomitrium patens TaxID=3218 RepID=A0A7I4FDV6_PHYPA|nr:EVI5-like protein isoform X2 [Physcomitrium patens]|eukprot:XP_024359488.1 EVI5-like protein isoform X2 [Physcomitrella patens]
MSTGMRVGLVGRRGKAKDFAKNLLGKNEKWKMDKIYPKGRKNSDSSLDPTSDQRLMEDRSILGFKVRPQHLEEYLKHQKTSELEEIARLDCWVQFLQTYSDPGGSGRAESATDEAESGWWVVEEALAWRKRAKENNEFEDGVSDSRGRYGVQDGGNIGACHWAEELRTLVWGGVPSGLRGEMWQIFSGAKQRRVKGYYNDRLGRDAEGAEPSDASYEDKLPPFKSRPLEKWASQIEKDLSRTFPGHPQLKEDGLGQLRRILTAYARHNPSVGYCQAMNFLAALLLLLMPEEDAFWTLTSLIDGYFEGYYTEKMAEAQIDQLVFASLVFDHIPELADHLKAVDVEVSWFSGAWFLSIFVNVLPWESVLRVWDVLLYEGDRSMLFRTAMALLKTHADELIQRDNEGVLSLLQSMGETAFDSNELIILACTEFRMIDDEKLEKLRSKHRPALIASLHQRSLDLRQWRISQAAKQETIESHETSIPAVSSLNIAEDEEKIPLEEPQLSSPRSLSGAEDENSSDLDSQFSCQKSLNDAEDRERGIFESQLSIPKFYEYADDVDSSLLSPLFSPSMFRNFQPKLNTSKCFKSGSYSRIDERIEYDDAQIFDLHKQVEELKAQVAHLEETLANQEETITQAHVLEHKKAEESRQRAEEDLQIANKALRSTVEQLASMEERALLAESRLQAMEKRAMSAEKRLEGMERRAVTAESILETVGKRTAEELAAMEKRAVMAESTLAATLEFHANSVPSAKRSAESKLKGSEMNNSSALHQQTIPNQGEKFQHRSGRHEGVRQDGDSAWERSQNVRRQEEAEILARLTANKKTVMSRPYVLQERKVYTDHKKDDLHLQEVGGSSSGSLHSSSSQIKKIGNIQYNNSPPELVKLQYIKRGL